MSNVTYTRETLIKDLINSISLSENKAIHLGYGTPEAGVDRQYIAEVAEFAVKIVNRLDIKT